MAPSNPRGALVKFGWRCELRPWPPRIRGERWSVVGRRNWPQGGPKAKAATLGAS